MSHIVNTINAVTVLSLILVVTVMVLGGASKAVHDSIVKSLERSYDTQQVPFDVNPLMRSLLNGQRLPVCIDNHDGQIDGRVSKSCSIQVTGVASSPSDHDSEMQTVFTINSKVKEGSKKSIFLTKNDLFKVMQPVRGYPTVESLEYSSRR